MYHIRNVFIAANVLKIVFVVVAYRCMLLFFKLYVCKTFYAKYRKIVTKMRIYNILLHTMAIKFDSTRFR